ncbi:hypothetical protein FGO68_gene7853 [Halteria grandinella]|uniref:Peroxisomal membrane protein 4 n=1 Tax=Halteria grandinella TaxID=5974 RepID=A0A8J8NMV0_HALGN|nr:hypothetical protein FGO68_gene7853 [Halteria grandinella]
MASRFNIEQTPSINLVATTSSAINSNLLSQPPQGNFQPLKFEQEPQQTPASLQLFFNHPCSHSNCLIAAIRGFRNGLYYGGKVRFAHAVVMAILFQSGVSPLQKLKTAIKLAWMHGRNLGSFVFVYKIAQCVLQQLFRKHHPAFSFIAGVIGAYVVWRDKNSINQQIVFYLLSRVLEGSAKRLQKAGHLNFIPSNFEAFPWLSMVVWGIVMYLFEDDKSVLQGSLQSSMQFLYKDSDQVAGWRDFVPFYIPGGRK